ncbi:MAG: hypothetical protein K1X88_24155 [Nannocystaceae bacterium]|nr:hypothetical protein [Nannocystaceae bacterium]
MMLHRVLHATGVLALSLAISLSPRPAQAGPAEDDASFEQARTLHRRAQAKYETFDYLGAIQLWTEAYDQIAGHPRAATVRAAIVYNLASARQKQFEIDHDRNHLELARRLLESYRDALPEPGDDEALQAEHTRVQAKLDELSALLEQDTPTTTAAPDTTTPADAGGSSAHAGRGVIIGGAVSTGLGVALLGGMGAGLAIGGAAQRDGDDPGRAAAELDALTRKGEAANRLAIATGVLGGLAVAAGVTLLALGFKARARARKGGHARALQWAGGAWHF